MAPSIIFLDELDGLVPARSANSSGGDQVFASVVSTLLALMDGVVDRGAVVVIGATNRWVAWSVSAGALMGISVLEVHYAVSVALHSLLRTHFWAVAGAINRVVAVPRKLRVLSAFP